ncbi:hypothetical protein [Microbacterium sp. KNMS]
MNVAWKLTELATAANTRLSHATEALIAARAEVVAAHEEQSIAIRALAAVDGENTQIMRGHRVEAGAMKALRGHVEEQDE